MMSYVKASMEMGFGQFLKWKPQNGFLGSEKNEIHHCRIVKINQTKTKIQFQHKIPT